MKQSHLILMVTLLLLLTPWSEAASSLRGLTPALVPEPATLLLLGSGLMSLGYASRRRIMGQPLTVVSRRSEPEK